jgi:uncharacterized membrane protein
MKILTYYQSSTWRNIFRLLLIGNIYCCLLITLRVLWFQETMYLFLIWNLFLAGLPLVFAFALKYLTDLQNSNVVVRLMLFALWLLFLPNSPYIITDLVHLSHKRVTPLWFDGSIVFSSALVGLMMGLISLYIIHQMIRPQLNHFTNWIVLSLLIGLTSFGVYLGRVLRWNSWDLFTRPIHLFGSIYESLFRFSAVSMTVVFSCMLFFIYLMVYNILEKKY